MEQPEQGQAARRWRRLVRARLAEMERLDPEGATLGASFWDSRARRFAARMTTASAVDPFLRRVHRVARRRSTVLDIGAGPGRYALALAPKVAEVVAVDASPVMLSLLARSARRSDIDNVTTVAGPWEEVQVEPAAIVICSHVLPLVENAAGFLTKLHASCAGDAFVYLSAMASDAVTDPFWCHFHGSPRRPGPTYLDAVAVLGELGISADVEVVEVPARSHFTSLTDATRAYRDSLLLPDTAEMRRELRRLLSPWLLCDGGSLRPPLSATPAAILHWNVNRRSSPRDGRPRPSPPRRSPPRR